MPVNKSQTFFVALYTGKNKCTPVQEYLADFFGELKKLLSERIVITHQVYTLSLVGHRGYCSCERCLVKRSWSGRVVFNNEEQHSLRNENDFFQILYQNLNKGLPPLLQLKVRCLSMVTLDYMHFICLGAVR